MRKGNGGNIARTIQCYYSRLFILFLLYYLNLHDGELKVITDAFPATRLEEILRYPAYITHSLPVWYPTKRLLLPTYSVLGTYVILIF